MHCKRIYVQYIGHPRDELDCASSKAWMKVENCRVHLAKNKDMLRIDPDQENLFIIICSMRYQIYRVI